MDVITVIIEILTNIWAKQPQDPGREADRSWGGDDIVPKHFITASWLSVEKRIVVQSEQGKIQHSFGRFSEVDASNILPDPGALNSRVCRFPERNDGFTRA